MNKINSLKYLIICLFLFIFASAALASQDIAISVDDRTVTMDQYLYNYRNYLDSYRAYYGSKYDQEKEGEMKKQLINDLIESEIYMEEAEKRGLTAKIFISEEEIEEIMMKEPVFYTDGKFDPVKYESAKISTEVNWSELRKKAEDFLTYENKRVIMPSKVLKALKDEVVVGDDELVSEYRKNNELIKCRYIPVDAMKYSNEMKIGEDEMRQYVDEHKEDFVLPKAKKYKLLFFDPKNYLDMVSVTDTMKKNYFEKHRSDYMVRQPIKAKFVLFDYRDYADQIHELGINPNEYYEENVDKYVEPAKVKLRYVFIKYDRNDAQSIRTAQDKLKSVIDELNTNISFATVAKKYSDDPATADQGGDLGYVEKGKLNDPFDSVLFSLNNGDISGVLQTDRGYYIMKVEEKIDERVKFYPEVREEIEAELLKIQAKPMLLLAAKRFAIEARKVGFDEYSKKRNMTVYRTENIGSNDRIPLIGRNQNFSDTALTIGSGEVSDVIEYENGYVVFQLEERASSESLSYDDVAASIEASIKENNIRIFAEKDAEHVRDKLMAGVPFETIVGENIRVVTNNSDWIEGGDVNFMYSSFQYKRTPLMNKEGDISEVIERPEGYYLVYLSKEREPHLPELSSISRDVARIIAVKKGEEEAKKEAQTVYQLILDGKTMEAVADERSLPLHQAGPFNSRDYLIDGKYMVDFIGGCFKLKQGDKAIVRNLDSFCVVDMLWRGIDNEAFNKNRTVILSDMLRAKRKEHLAKWLSDKMDSKKVVVNVN